MKKQQIRNSFLLLLTAIIWGGAFVSQSVGMEYVQPFTFNGVRSIIGGLVLIPCIAVLNHTDKKKKDNQDGLSLDETKRQNKELLIGGICCGVVLCFASSFQQFGIQYTTVGKAGFITAFYIIIVPILGLFFKKKCGISVWIGVILALFGLYYLCMNESLSIQKGDFFVFVCAILFSIHIMVIDHFTQRVDGVKMSCIQFFVCGILCLIAMFLFESPQVPDILAAWKPILYAGVMSCGVAYTLQIVGQKGMNPTIASLILSLESVVSVLAGMLLLNQHLSGREILGCIFMFAAIVMAQLPERKKKRG